MRYPFLIIDDSPESIKETLNRFESFPEYFCVGTATNTEEAVNNILQLQPQLVFLEIKPKSQNSSLSLAIINNLHQYLNALPYFIVLTEKTDYAYEAIKAGVSDYLLKPLTHIDLMKCLLKFQKMNPDYQKVPEFIKTETEEEATDPELKKINPTICIKSYGNYQFISLDEVIYLKADNNTTDFHLKNGKVLTAYKTLKHYEINLPPYFFRIHNSYIVNSNYISRINTGKSLCYLNNNEISIAFSKTFKENVDAIIRLIAPDYL